MLLKNHKVIHKPQPKSNLNLKAKRLAQEQQTVEQTERFKALPNSYVATIALEKLQGANHKKLSKQYITKTYKRFSKI